MNICMKTVAVSQYLRSYALVMDEGSVLYV